MFTVLCALVGLIIDVIIVACIGFLLLVLPIALLIKLISFLCGLLTKEEKDTFIHIEHGTTTGDESD